MKAPAIPSFRPIPLLKNPHLQTVLGNLFHSNPVALPAHRHAIDLGDGDQLMVHDTTPKSWRPGFPIVVLVHGLGGSHSSSYMIRMNNHLARQGLRVLRLDLRGAGAGARLSKQLYNAGCSSDVRQVMRWLHEQAPTSPQYLVGMSMGGNIALKLAGEAATEPVPGLAGLASISAPINLERCCQLIEMVPMYDKYYVQQLLKQLRRHQRHFPALPKPRFPRKLSMRGFDELYTAPVAGYAGHLDYYRRASACPLIPQIQVPALLLTARDDPFIAVEPFEELPARPNLHVHIVEHGGHMGFLGWDGKGGVRWAEQQVIRWVLGLVRQGVGKSQA